MAAKSRFVKIENGSENESENKAGHLNEVLKTLKQKTQTVILVESPYKNQKWMYYDNTNHKNLLSRKLYHPYQNVIFTARKF